MSHQEREKLKLMQRLKKLRGQLGRVEALANVMRTAVVN